ncbi:uncharacterized protein LACBIDRAFT_321394 [Laccaria bicolor S238N-H82]|uniref:Predicted protein n=1 Tax=Laccaria bicolor (strain S238N-H82 / ATCC MYA-4686) TaxID=486041 RepID=B0CQ14_LACBS|nr:uncharacterized protein LACBIDRAFT_321394 [Laccaria bicolor S238N-H82]EDR15509.1 predicted protein [Laccaria bicolor S238N-H82]|eukprot:XP_001873717.1 predicted protein [Laccaria bicolor S238N-H82]
MRPEGGLLLPCLQRSIYQVAVELVQAATCHVADEFLSAVALVWELHELSQLFLLVYFSLFVAPDLLALICVAIGNAFGMVSDTMEVEPRAPLLPLVAQMNKQASAMNTEHKLPFPGPLSPDGTRDVRYLALDGQPKSTLKEWCREFRLPVSGNVPQLMERLREYSGDDNKWKSLGAVKMRSHKGPRSSGKPQRHQKQSQVRCAALFKSNPALDAPLRVMHALPTERSMDRRTAQQVAMVVPWRSGEARSPSDLPLNTAGGRDASAVSSSPTEVASPLTPVHLYLPYSLPSASLSRFEVPSCLGGLPHCPPSDISMQSPSTPLIEGDRTPAMDIDPSPLDHCPTSLAPSCKIFGFWLLCGTTPLQRGVESLSPPFTDIPSHSNSGRPSTGTGSLPYGKRRRGTPEDFNAAFTVNGQLQSYTAIEKAITQARIANDRILSVKAREEYGADFDQVFLYRRTRDGAWIVMSKDSSIARHYCRLQGEAQEDEEGDSDEGI